MSDFAHEYNNWYRAYMQRLNQDLGLIRFTGNTTWLVKQDPALPEPEFPTEHEQYDRGYRDCLIDILEQFGHKHFDKHGLPLDMELTMWAAQIGITLSDEEETA